MKKWIVLMLVAASVSVQAQEFTAPVPGRGRAPAAPPPPPRPGVRVGDILQMVNPFAPREYGSGWDLMYSQEERQGDLGPNPNDDRTHQQVKTHAVRLFSIAFW